MSGNRRVPSAAGPTGGCPMDGCPQVGVLQHMFCLAGRVGVCPIPRVAWGTCLDLCSFDEECPWGQKCCSNGCGHICMPASLEGEPWPGMPVKGRDRDGICCALSPQQHCGRPAPIRTSQRSCVLGLPRPCLLWPCIHSYPLHPLVHSAFPSFYPINKHAQPQLSTR